MLEYLNPAGPSLRSSCQHEEWARLHPQRGFEFLRQFIEQNPTLFLLVISLVS